MFQFIKDSISNPLEQINSFSKVVEYKMNVQNKVVFLNTTTTSPLRKKSEEKKRERINLTEDAKDSYSEKFQIVKEETVECSRRQKHLPTKVSDLKN